VKPHNREYNGKGVKRLLVMTVGKTHSGKTTFAKMLEKDLEHSLVIDQDNHADFINTHYKVLLPKRGANTIKYAVTETIVNHAVTNTNLHLILCNANRSRASRAALLKKFHEAGFTSVLVYFDLPNEVLTARVARSNRSTNVFRSASSFEEVLQRQNAESSQDDMAPPTKDETNHYFEISSNDEIQSMIEGIVQLSL
jgi:predicted kinase